MRWLRSQAGDTLVEVIFALVILSSILVTTLSIGRVSRVSGENSQARTQTINLVQEQYEALKSFRDNVSYAQFLGSCGGSCTTNGINVAQDAVNCPSLSAPIATCLIHMERDPRQVVGGSNNPYYGNWVPCKGSWNPPIDSDSGWSSRAFCGGGSTLSDVTVGIQLLGDVTCHSFQKVYTIPFQFNGSWAQGGVKTTNSTSLNAIIANTKGDTPC